MKRIVLNLKGGLGNQLFQLRAIIKFFESRNDELEFCTSSYDHDSFKRYPSLLNLIDRENLTFTTNPDINLFRLPRLIKTILPFLGVSYFSDARLIKPTRLHRAFGSEYYLDGYFQEPGSITDSEKQILDLWLKSPDNKSFDSTDYRHLFKRISNNTKSCMIHIRGSDYKSLVSLYGLPTKDYFVRALDIMNRLDSDILFFVFSDDPGYARELLDGLLVNCIYICDFNLNLLQEFSLMRLFSKYILSNSTFGWWASQLCVSPSALIMPYPWCATLPYSDKIYPRHAIMLPIYEY